MHTPQVLEALEPQAAVVTTTDISDFAGLGAETSIEDASLVSISYSLSTVLTDPELDDQEWNSLAAGCTSKLLPSTILFLALIFRSGRSCIPHRRRRYYS